MAERVTDADKNLQLDGLGANITHLSLHTSDPALTGANEATGGTYARQSVTFSAAAAGKRASVGQQVFTGVPAGSYSWLGYWGALSGGTFYRAKQFAQPITLSAQGSVTITDASLEVAAET